MWVGTCRGISARPSTARSERPHHSSTRVCTSDWCIWDSEHCIRMCYMSSSSGIQKQNDWIISRSPPRRTIAQCQKHWLADLVPLNCFNNILQSKAVLSRCRHSLSPLTACARDSARVTVACLSAGTFPEPSDRVSGTGYFRRQVLTLERSAGVGMLGGR